MNTYVQQLKEDYEKRLRAMKRSLHGEKERRRQLAFQYKQLDAQLKKVRKGNDSVEKQLKTLRKCASCSNLDQQSKSYIALNELLCGPVPVLEAKADVSSTNATNRTEEIRILKVANRNLLQFADKLQSMLKEKVGEAMAFQKYYNEAIFEREKQVCQLQKELEIRSKGTSLRSMASFKMIRDMELLVSENAEAKMTASMKERTEVQNKIRSLESENTVNNTVDKKSQRLNKREGWSGFVIDELSAQNRYLPEDSFSKKVLLKSYHELLRRYDSLEIELGKRRKAELFATNIANQIEQESTRTELPRAAEMKIALEKANARIALLESESSNAKQSIIVCKQMQQQIDELQKQKKESMHILESQKAKLCQMEDEIAILVNEKKALQCKCEELERASNLARQEKLEQLEFTKKLREELSRLEEKHNETLEAHNIQIEAYQELIKQKDDERGALIAELCAVNRSQVQFHDSFSESRNFRAEPDEYHVVLKELRELYHEKQTASEKIVRLENELADMKDQLKRKSEEAEKEAILKNSMQNDLVKARTVLLRKEAEVHGLSNELKIAEVNVSKLETELANTTDRLQIEHSTVRTLKITIEELEDLLQEKNVELNASGQERQQSANEMQKMKELVYDLETKLTLQGRELRESRENYAALRKKILEHETLNWTKKEKFTPL